MVRPSAGSPNHEDRVQDQLSVREYLPGDSLPSSSQVEKTPQANMRKVNPPENMPKPTRSDRRLRSTGRPRLQSEGPTGLSEERRNQIRRAQRTYRLKKASNLQQAKDRAIYLERKLENAAEMLAEFKRTLHSEIGDTYHSLTRGIDSIYNVLVSDEKLEQHSQPKQPNSLLPTHQSRLKSMARKTHTDVMANSSSNCVFGYETTKQADMDDSFEPDYKRCPQPEEDMHPHYQPSTTVIYGPSRSMNTLYTYSFQEKAFPRRLHRYCLEHAFRLFQDPRSHPLEVYRVFRLVPCFKDSTKMYPYLQRLVSADADEPLEIRSLPFYCIGGAGSHYPAADSMGNPIYPAKMRIPRRILGLFPLGSGAGEETINGQDWDPQRHLEMCGFGGQWFDCRDVEGYLEDQGVDLTRSSSRLFPRIRHDRRWKDCTLDIESFFQTLLRGVVILGRAPGFRQAEVVRAFQAAVRVLDG